MLLLGFFIGFLVNGRITRARISKMQNFYTEPGFNRALMRIIRPTPDQRKELIPILRKYARENRERLMEFRKAQSASIDSLEQEIKPILNHKQIKRLEKAKRKRTKWMKNKPHRQRPLPGMQP